MKLQSQPMPQFYDVGANVGTHTLALASTLGERVRVRAFEAQPVIHEMLCGTLALNRLSTVTAHLNAVADVAGEILVFDLPDYGRPNNFGGFEIMPVQHSDNQDMSRSGHRATVQTVTIDGFAEEVDLIKIDVEGMELQVLRGAADTLARARPVVMVEILKSNPEEISALLVERDYEIFLGGTDILATPREMGLGQA